MLFLIPGYAGLQLQDEGYLWYGTQRVMLGEAPVRDFMSYNPRRYYWSAAIRSSMSKNGIIALRLAVSVFQAIGLFIFLFLVFRSTPVTIGQLSILVVTIVLWVYPRHVIPP